MGEAFGGVEAMRMQAITLAAFGGGVIVGSVVGYTVARWVLRQQAAQVRTMYERARWLVRRTQGRDARRYRDPRALAS